MEHFAEEVLTDFVRGIPGDKERADVEAHLQECTECTATLNVWKQVKAMADCEAMYSPPENSVRMAKLEFAATCSEDVEATAKLTFDTFAQPLLAGVRSMTATARQMVYEADGLTVDLRFDRRPGSKEVHLVGQVLDKRVPRSSVAGGVVTLWTVKGLPLAEVSTNAHGEFHLDFQEQERLRLSIHVIGRPIFRIPLADLRDENENGDSYTGNQ